MVSGEEDGGRDEIQEEQAAANRGRKLVDYIPIYIPTVEEGLLDEEPHESRFLDILRAHPSGDWYLESGFSGERSGMSPPEHPPAVLGAPRRGRRFRVPFVRKIKWGAMVSYIKEWIKDPMNMAMLAWGVACAAGLLLMVALMTGMLNGVIEPSSRRKKWMEVDTQILNALFMIVCLYQHPKFIHQLVLLLRWRPKDAAELRRIYSKKGVPRPHERAHMTVVQVLIHITFFAQYALCGLYWGYSRSDRPDSAESLCIVVGVAAPVVAGLYIVYGPLGRKVEEGDHEVAADTRLAEQLAARVPSRRVVVTLPEWVGGLFDCWDDMAVFYLSFFCTFCVFGWNMERLGFGNMYVHIATFVLVIISPVWVFYVASLNIDNDVIQTAVGISGAVLCVFGLLYGGFWRIQIRKKFKLPSNGFCCGWPNVTDSLQWLFCWACSLAQEVRTGNFYDIGEDKFYHKGAAVLPALEEEGNTPALRPLPRIGASGPLVVFPGLESSVRSYSCPPKIDLVAVAVTGGAAKAADPMEVEDNAVMAPPVPPQIWTMEHSRSNRNHSVGELKSLHF